MPRFDGTGPTGKGSRTGRGQGECPPKKEEEKKETQPRGFSRFLKRRRQRGRG